MNTSAKNNDYCIGFYMETSFHYEVYRNIIAELLKQKIRCELVINDLTERKFINEMMASLGKLNVPGLDCNLISVVLKNSIKYSCLITPYYVKHLANISNIHIRTLYGLAKNHWNHAAWNQYYNAILCYSHYTKKSLAMDSITHIVGNPRFDDWHNNNYNTELPTELKLSPEKKTILYAPTYGELSSIIPWAEKLARLNPEYNIITKLHHGTLYRESEVHALKIAKRHLKNIISDSNITLALLKRADYIITDNSGFIFDAINADKKIILLDWPELASLLDNNKSFTSVNSPDQLVRDFIPTARDMVDIRKYLADDYVWQQHAPQFQHIRTEYCDAFNDGQAAKRAAQVIINTLSHAL